MSDNTVELLHRNLQEVFGENDAARRSVAVRELYTEDCVLHVPDGVFEGREALDDFAGKLRETHPHFVYTPQGEAQVLHDCGILAWGSGPKNEPFDYTGLDVVITKGDQIAVLYVYLNPNFG